MKNILKIIGIILGDVFTSKFMKTVYKVLTGIVIFWLLFIPTLALSEVYKTVPGLNFIFEPREDFPEARFIDRIDGEAGVVERRTYKEVFMYSFENWYVIPIMALAGILLTIAVLAPLIPLVTALLMLALLYERALALIDFIKKLPKTIKSYKEYIAYRLNGNSYD